jgi:hypothetical protein
MIIKTEIGTEKSCARCKESWPADTEFFYKRGDRLHSYCIACCTERKRELRNGATRKIKLYTRRAHNQAPEPTCEGL